MMNSRKAVCRAEEHAFQRVTGKRSERDGEKIWADEYQRNGGASYTYIYIYMYSFFPARSRL